MEDNYICLFVQYPDVVGTDELCDMLGGISRKLVYRILQEGQIPSLRIGFRGADNEGYAGQKGACECHRDAEAGKTKNSQQRGSAEEDNSCGCSDSAAVSESEEEDTVNTIPAPVAFTFAAFLLSLIFLGEKLIFSRGEKRRQAGQRYAHTKQAMWLAIIAGILSAISEVIPDSEDELANKA